MKTASDRIRVEIEEEAQEAESLWGPRSVL